MAMTKKKIVTATVAFDHLQTDEGVPFAREVTIEVSARAAFETVQQALINRAFLDAGVGASVSNVRFQEEAKGVVSIAGDELLPEDGTGDFVNVA